MLARMLLTGLGILGVAAGCWLIYPPAGVIAAGLGVGSAGLLWDDK